jgi:hypothetical protein
VSRFSRFFFKNRRYDDISVSIQEHIDERIDELMEEGMSRDEAERTARRDFGNVTLVRERSREVWQWQRLESLLVDLKHVCRRLWRSPGFAITVVLTLAIGIGANTAVFSVLNSVLIRPLSYPEPQQLVAMRLNAPARQGWPTSGMNYAYRPRCISPSPRITVASNRWVCGCLGLQASRESHNRSRSTQR